MHKSKKQHSFSNLNLKNKNPNLYNIANILNIECNSYDVKCDIFFKQYFNFRFKYIHFAFFKIVKYKV